MKARNLNNSSVKTRKLIRTTFAEMLSEKKEIGKISVSELAARANINRGTFYSHYDDIYSVADDYETELIENFFDNARLLASDNAEQFIDAFFDYIKENDENYKMICKSDDIIFTAGKLVTLVENNLLELCNRNRNLKNREFIETEINVFVEGLIFEYIKYCRGSTSVTPETLYAYTKEWHRRFTEYHF